jgi:hypothetical protein
MCRRKEGIIIMNKLNNMDFTGKNTEFREFIDFENACWKSGTRYCKVCNDQFVITALQVANFYKYDYSLPKKCEVCRKK